MPSNKMLFHLLLAAFLGCLGAVTTYYLQSQGISPVVASCLVGLFGALLAHWFSYQSLPYILFAASFVGMSNFNGLHYGHITVAGAICGILFVLSQSIFVGFGGKLGTTAFISTLLSYVLLYTWENWKS